MNIMVIVNRNFHGLYTPILDTLKQKGHQTTLIEIGKISKFRYTSVRQRIRNFLSKNLLGHNLKQEFRYRHTTEYLERLKKNHDGKPFDLIVVNHPDTCNSDHILQLKELSRTLSAHLWDSHGKEPQFFTNIGAYDNVISFDPIDAKNYGFIGTTNYLDNTIEALPTPEKYAHDVFAVMSYDKARYRYIEQLIDSNPDVNFDITIYVQSEHRRKHITHKSVSVIDRPLAGDKLLSRIAQSRAILDIGHEHQHGLSFRVLESLGYERKLVTTNAYVKEYPFYTKQNIFCIASDNINIKKGFFNSPYQKIDESIVEQYRLNQWVDDYLDKLTRGSPHR